MAASLMLGQSLCSKKNESTPPLHHLGLNHYLFDLTLQISLSHDEIVTKVLHSIDMLSIIQTFCLSVHQSRCQSSPDDYISYKGWPNSFNVHMSLLFAHAA